MNGQPSNGECKYKQKINYNIETNYKHYKGGYGRLSLDNVYMCHGFF